MKDEDLSVFLALNSLKQFDGNLIAALRLRSIAPSVLMSSPSLLREFTNSERAMERWYEVLSSGWHLRELESCKKKGIKNLVFNEEGYPSSLNRLSNPPLLLYWWGRLECIKKFAVAVVGTRRCSNYGRRIAHMLGFKVAEEGFPVVSGGAFGIDEKAHRGALKAQGATVAVFGTGVDQCYPAKNLPLFDEIKESGALISEYPLGTKGMPWNFPERNRIIAGLADVVVIVEAPTKSGAMITGRIAMECGIETWSVPGRIDEGVAKGSNLIIFDGAYPLVDVDSFIHLIKGSPEGFLIGRKEDKAEELPLEEKRIYEMLREKGDRTVDNIARECKISPALALELLGKLESRGLVTTTGPGRWGIRL